MPPALCRAKRPSAAPRPRSSSEVTPAELVVEATWEPNGEIDDETMKLLAEADLSVSPGANGQPVVFDT